FEQEINYALTAEFNAMRLWRLRLRQSVSVEEEHIAFFQIQCFALVLLFVEDSEQQPACFQSPPFARSLDQQRRVMSRVTVINGLRFSVENGVNESEKQFPAPGTVQAQIGVAPPAPMATPPAGHA